MTRTREFVKAGLLSLCIGTAQAQLDLLTPREAVQIVALMPEVADARKQGSCPRFSTAYGDTLDVLGVQVRCGCGPYAGQWIDTYDINLRTGVVSGAAGPQGKKPLESPEGEALARRLLKEAAARLLSPGEARCLALEAAKSLPGWGGPGHQVSVQPLGALGVRFRALLHMEDHPPVSTDWFLTVDPSTASVHDDKTGMDIVSPGLAALASRMLILRLPSLLSDFDALEIAREVPKVKAHAAEPCSVVYVGGPLSWDKIFVTVQTHCEGSAEVRNLSVEIDASTGAVIEPDTGKQIESSGAARVVRERLEALRRERTVTRESLEATCGVQ
jgi:hypothetical protein